MPGNSYYTLRCDNTVPKDLQLCYSLLTMRRCQVQTNPKEIELVCKASICFTTPENRVKFTMSLSVSKQQNSLLQYRLSHEHCNAHFSDIGVVLHVFTTTSIFCHFPAICCPLQHPLHLCVAPPQPNWCSNRYADLVALRALSSGFCVTARHYEPSPLSSWLSSWHGDSFPRIKRAEAVHPSGGPVKNAWSYSSTPK
jgi:hypothetical protein